MSEGPRSGATSSSSWPTPASNTSRSLRPTSSRPTGRFPKPGPIASSAITPTSPRGWSSGAGRLIAYSLGNFVFWQPGDLYYRRTGFFLVLHVRRGRLSSYELHPYRITERGIRRLGRPEETAFRKKLDHISKPLASPKGVSEAWQAYLAYYGPAGFKKEVLGILEKMETEPRKGAAMFRNRVTTLQHAELWRDALTRFMAEKPAPPRPAWTRLIDEWLTKPLAPETR